MSAILFGVSLAANPDSGGTIVPSQLLENIGLLHSPSQGLDLI